MAYVDCIISYIPTCNIQRYLLEIQQGLITIHHLIQIRI